MQLVKLIKDCIKSPTTPDKKGIRALVKSIMHPNAQEHAFKTVAKMIAAIDCIQTPEDVAAELGKRAFKQSFSIFKVDESADENHSKHLYLFITTPPTGLPKKDYYAPKTKAEKLIYGYYKYMVKQLGAAFGQPSQDQFVEMERSYVRLIDAAEEEETVTMTGDAVRKLAPRIPWDKFWEPFDISFGADRKIVVYSKAWLRYVNKLFSTWTIADWKCWLKGSLVLQYGIMLPDKQSAMFSHLYNYLLTGNSVKPSRTAHAIKLVKKYMQIPLSRLYAAKYCNKGFQNEMRAFIDTIVEATVKRIETIEWMTVATKKRAAEKVRKIHFGILFMDARSYNYTTPQLGDDVIDNFAILGSAYMKRALANIAKIYTSDIWDEVPIYNVNAYYMSAGNRLFIPDAIAKWPFYCKEASAGWNYGGLGAVIGHEITHAFDENGKDFDEDGNKAEWWSAADKREYKRKTAALIADFDAAQLYNKHVDGEQTLSENIADLGGLGIALEALKEHLGKQRLNDEERAQMYKDFFQAYATSWREKDKKANAMRELLTDVHAPAMFRVNNIVRHFQEWYDAYAIKVGDPLYLEPEKRLRII